MEGAGVRRSWFKLVGNSDLGGKIDRYWLGSPNHEPLDRLMRFPKHRLPTNISHHEPIVCYAVGWGRIYAIQSRQDTLERLNVRRGRYPHEVDVVTHVYIEDLEAAPEVADVLPAFTKEHLPKMRQGSHFLLRGNEYDAFKQAMISSPASKTVTPPAL